MSRLCPQDRLSSSQQDGVSEAVAVALPPRRTETMQEPLPSAPDSGMIVFSSSARIMHMNGPARTFMALFGKSHELWPQMTPESTPSFLTEFCRDVLAQLQQQIDTENWAQFELRRTCHMVTPSLLLTGFGVPNSSGRELQVIVTLNPLYAAPHTADDLIRPQPTAQTATARAHA